MGRETELAQLHQLLDKALHGERQLVFVTGEPGIGKTTLIEAFLLGIGEQGARGWGLGVGPSSPHAKFSTPSTEHPTPSPWIGRGQCIDHYGAGEAYLPVLTALEQLCREPGHEQLIALLRQHAPLWLAQLPSFLSLEERERFNENSKVQPTSACCARWQHC